MSVEITLLDDDVLPHDKPVCSHFFDGRQDAANVLVGVNESDDDGKFSAGIHQMRGLYPLPTEEAGYRMCNRSRIDIFAVQVIENLDVQWTMAPLVSFV